MPPQKKNHQDENSVHQPEGPQKPIGALKIAHMFGKHSKLALNFRNKARRESGERLGHLNAAVAFRQHAPFQKQLLSR